MTPAAVRREFSRVVDTPRLIDRGKTHSIQATAEERAALAARFGLNAIDRLDAKINLELLAGEGLVRLTASLRAEVVQTCVVTLEPLPATVVETFTILYGVSDDVRVVVLDGDADVVEPLENGCIDIGEAVAQQLSLALDPFPRSPQPEAP
jgi:uncharacterized metal-binding protein YceD (DUF177 family)